MNTDLSFTVNAPTEEQEILEKVIKAVHAAGTRVLEIYTPDARPLNREEIFEAGQRNEAASLSVLRSALKEIQPQAQWVEDDQETILLPSGEWWVVDAVEGNVNHVHGLPEWCITVALLRDNTPVLAVVYQPIGDLTYTAIRGEGAYLNGRALHTSAKTDLAMAIAMTGQAEAGQALTYRRIGDSITTMLSRALLVRATVPSTFPLLLLAAGHYDIFWQYEPVLPGVAAGALLVTEAGGIVSDTHGQPWQPGSPDFLATAPNLHSATVKALATIA